MLLGNVLPAPSTTETGLASSSSKIRLEAPRPFMMVPKKEVSPISDDPTEISRVNSNDEKQDGKETHCRRCTRGEK